MNPASLLSADERSGWDALGARYLAVRSSDQRTETDEEIVDLDGSLLEWMRQFGVGSIAVRPDKFVAASDAAGLGVPDPAGVPPLPPPA